jgi:hypothetical protein
MRFVRVVFLSLCILPGVAFSGQAPRPNQNRTTQKAATASTNTNGADSHVTPEVVPPRAAFADVLLTYHASITPAAAEVAKPTSPKNKAAARIGSERVPAEQNNKAKATVQQNYKAEVVTTSLGSLRSDILARIPPGDEPLKQYIEARFPRTPATQTGYISEDDLKLVNGEAEGLVMELRSMEGFTVDLMVRSSPRNATFTYVPAFQKENELSIQTDDTIQQMWRGPYVSTVQVEGYWPVTSKFNTVSQKGDVLECTLVPKNSPEGGQCALK